jgi:hypothetical protein
LLSFCNGFKLFAARSRSASRASVMDRIIVLYLVLVLLISLVLMWLAWLS